MKKTRLLKAILRQDFRSFIEKVFNELNPGIQYENNWHIDFLAEKLCSNNIGKRLIVNIPPRSLKSIIASVAYPAYILGKDPTKRIITASFAKSLSIKHSLDTRFIMESDWYRDLFPGTILSSKQNQKSKFLTSKGGFRMAVSVGSMVTGEGGDILIIDDPHNPSHIHSEKRRSQVIDWYEQTFSTRLNNKEKGKIFLIMQRLHEKDLTWHLEREQNFELISIPIMSPIERKYIIGNKKYIQKEGEIFHPSRFSAEIIKKIENEMGYRNFSAQYMQSPIPDSKGMISKNELCFYEKIEEKFDYYILSIDSAIQTNDNSDYSVCTIWGIKDDRYYLAFLYREKHSYPDLKRRIIYYIRKYRPKYTLIEDHASGSPLIQDLRFDGYENITPIRQKLDKITRFASVLGLLQSGKVLLLEKEIIIRELTLFPHSKNDDIVDSISQFLSFMKEQKRKNIRIREI